MKADLHIHSHYSNDGEKSITELVELCRESELDMFTITDHNGTGGNEEAARLAAGIENLTFVPGIEIDCHYRGFDLHLLGFHIDYAASDFLELEKAVDKKYMDAIPEMIHKLAREGMQVDEEELMAKARGKVPSAELFAELMLANPAFRGNEKLKPYMPGGRRSDMPLVNFYLDYFAQGKPAYVEINHLPFGDAIELIRVHGGIPVVAHPGLNFKGKEEKVGELLERGAAGLEVFNNYHSREEVRVFARLAENHKALMTSGSDYHGKIKPLIGIGQFIQPEAYRDLLTESLKKLS